MSSLLSSLPATAHLAVLLTVLASPAPLWAQAPGTPIRVQTAEHASRWITGTTLAETADSLIIVRRAGRDTLGYAMRDRQLFPVTEPREDPDTVRLARSTISRVEVRGGRTSNADRGALIGAAVVGSAGLGIGIACAGDEFLQCTGGDVAAVTAVGAISGALVGAVIGALSHRERWLSVGITPGVTTRGHGQLTVGLVSDF